MAKIKLKSNYYKQFKNGTISREENNRLKNRLNKEINHDKDKYYQTIFGNSKGNMKKSWNTLSSLLGTQKNKSLTDKIFGDAITDSDKMRIVEEFNNFLRALGIHWLHKCLILLTHQSSPPTTSNIVSSFSLLHMMKSPKL